MDKSIPLCLSLGLMALLVGPDSGCGPVAEVDEPRYQGKSLGTLVKPLGNTDVRARRKAISALREAVLAQLADDQDLDLAEQAVPAFRRALKDKDPEVRATAAKALYRFGIGPDAEREVGRLIKALGGKDKFERYDAARDLALHHPANRAARAVLTKALKDPEAFVRRRAALTLALLGPEGKAAVPLLIEALKAKPDRLHFDYVEATDGLAHIGPDAKAAVPALARALRDEFPLVRASTAHALGRIGEGAGGARRDLRKALRDRHRAVRAEAAVALVRVGGEAKEALPVLIDALKGKDDPEEGHVEFYIVKRVVVTLGEMGPQAKAAAPALLPLVKDPSWGVRRETARALKKIDQEPVKKAGVVGA